MSGERWAIDGCDDSVYAEENELSGDWMVTGQQDPCHPMYACATKADAGQMIQTIDHWNKTGKKKAFWTQGEWRRLPEKEAA